MQILPATCPKCNQSMIVIKGIRYCPRCPLPLLAFKQDVDTPHIVKLAERAQAGEPLFDADDVTDRQAVNQGVHELLVAIFRPLAERGKLEHLRPGTSF